MKTATTLETGSAMILVDVFVSPSSIFKRLKNIKAWSFLALVMLCTVLFFSEYIFYSNMTPEWIVEQQMNLINNEIPVGQKQMVHEMMLQSSGNAGVMSGMFTVSIQLILVLLLSIYFYLFSKVMKLDVSYGDIFTFCIWVIMPILIQALGFIVLFATSTNPNLPISLAQYASINQLFLSLPVSHRLFTWASSISIFYVWSLTIATIGIRQLSNLSIMKSLIISTIPFVTIFGIWLLIA